MTATNARIDDLDRRIIAATQGGLPLDPDPYGIIGRELGVSGGEIRERLSAMVRNGIVRRLGAVPNHYALGMRANGMSVWDICDTQVDDLGQRVGALDFVSHCYRRPRHPPVWPYNLFAMVHGASRSEVEEKVEVIAGILGPASRGHDVLYSTRILKKTGLRIAPVKETADVPA